MLLHGVHRGLHGLLLAPDLAVGLDGPLVVQPHNGADVHDGGHHGRRAGHPARAPELGHIGGEELVVHLVAVPQHPLGRLLQGGPGVPHIRRRIHQQTVAGGGAQGVDDHDLLVGILLLQQLSGGLGVVHRAGLAGGEGNVQQVALLQLLLKEIQIIGHVDLGRLGKLARLQEPVKPGQSRRIPAHIVHILLVTHHIVVKQHRDVPLGHVRIGQVYRGAAAQYKFPFHILSPFRLNRTYCTYYTKIG